MDRLKEKLGGLPVWAWGVILGVAVVAWYWLSRRSTGTVALSTTTEDTTSPVSGWRDSSGVPVSSVTPVETPSSAVEGNGQWLSQGVKYLVEQGIMGTTASAALQKYLEGKSLTSAERTAVDKWIAAQGTPPDGVLDISAPDAEEVARQGMISKIQGWYQQFLGRSASTGEVASWTNQVDNGANISQVQTSIQNSPEAVKRNLEAQVRSWYTQYLGRGASASEVAFWVNSGSSAAAIQRGISGSPEAKKRAA